MMFFRLARSTRSLAHAFTFRRVARSLARSIVDVWLAQLIDGAMLNGEFVPHDPNEDGFYEGEIATGPRKGARGVVPSNYIELMSDVEQARVAAHVGDAPSASQQALPTQQSAVAEVASSLPPSAVAAAAVAPDGKVVPVVVDHDVVVPLLEEHELEAAVNPRMVYVLHDFDPRAEEGREDVDDELELFRGE